MDVLLKKTLIYFGIPCSIFLSHTDESFKDETRVCGYNVQNVLQFKRDCLLNQNKHTVLTTKKAGVIQHIPQFKHEIT